MLRRGILTQKRHAPAQLGSPSIGETTVAAVSITFSHTVPAGTKKLVVLIAAARNSTEDVSSVVFNTSEALTMRVKAASVVTGQRSIAAIYTLDNPTATTANIVVTMTDVNADSIYAYAINLDQVGVIADTQSDTSTSNRTNCSVTLAAANDPAIYLGIAVSSRVTSSFTPSAGSELDDQTTPGGATQTETVMARTEVVGGSYALSTACGASGSLAMVGMALRAA